MQYLKVIISELLHVFGALWLLVEAASFFISSQASDAVKSYWWIFLIIGIAISITRLIPKRRFHSKLKDRDITIELVIGDIFKQDGPIIVGSNTEFITTLEVISTNSIQGLFSNKYFPNSRSITDQINAQVGAGPHPFGTTVCVRSANKTGYFCAIAEINQTGVAKSNMENIRVSLAELWNFLSANAEKSILNIPILGSGFSRVSASREELTHEIIRSFIASTADHTFCDGIRLVIHPKDIEKYNIDVERLVEFLEYSCKYSIARADIGTSIGTAEA